MVDNHTELDPDKAQNPYRSPLTDASLDTVEAIDPDESDRVVIEETPVMRLAGKGVTMFTIASFIVGAFHIVYRDSPTLLNIGVILFVFWVACVLIFIIASLMQGGESLKP